MKKNLWPLGLLTLIFAGACGFVWFGAYNIAADVPHWKLTSGVIETIRDRSIAARASDIVVPDLDSEALIRAGAGNYDAMCAGCHLEPSEEPSEISAGLYPAPPNLTRVRIAEPAEAFWTIKHGVKMSGMAAWGKSMDDESIWGMVALLRRLPDLPEAGYHELVESSGGHSHAAGESGEHEEHEDSRTHATPQHLDAHDPAGAAAGTVDRFFAALSAGELGKAAAELDPEVVILESGGAEYSASEYLGHHAKEDAEFLKSAVHKLLRRSAKASGDLAWVASEGELHVQKNGKPVTIASTETMVLRATAAGWRIVHIHWSSRTIKP